jgi:hypothetical protein
MHWDIKMTQITRDRYIIFSTALLQVFFVAMQPLFIVHAKIVPMLLTGFLISLIWTFNVKRIAFGNWIDRLVYAIGAMVGTGLGFMISNFIIKWI